MALLPGMPWTSAAAALAGLTIVYIFLTAVYNRYFHPLKGYPGPFWASITELWHWYTLRYMVFDDIQLPLHQRYGTWVRVAPDILSVSDPAAIETVYSSHNSSGFTKNKFYEGFLPTPSFDARANGFSERDPVKHAERKRILASLYTQSSALEYEPCMDRVTVLFNRAMDGYAASGEVFDLSVWLHKYAFDVIGEMYYGKEGGFGMIRDNVDYNNWMKALRTMPAVGASKGYMPQILQPIWMLWEIIFGGQDARNGVWSMYQVVQDAKNATKVRVAARKVSDKSGNRRDVLNKLLDLVDEKGIELGWTPNDVAMELWAVIWAGADTTAIALCSMLYHLLKYPDTMAHLQSELDQAMASGRLALPVRYHDAVKLPYLNAVVQEGMRIHPVVGFGLPRTTPPNGAEVCGKWIPGNTTIVINPNVVHVDKGVFGDDADVFNPQRWLMNEKTSANMARHDMSFGHGTRVCTGRHITRTEMYKVLPTFLLNYDVELDKPTREWKVSRGWLQQQSEVFVRIRKRG